MNNQAKIVVGVLIAIVVGLGIAVGVMAAGDNHDSTSTAMGNHMGGNDNGYQGMMGAMGSMDYDDMLKHMREVLGEDGYQRMLTHLADHRAGTPMTGNTSVEDMMHTMMDGMMQRMPVGSGTVTLPSNDLHHETPTP